MRADSLLPSIAEQLRLTIIRPLAGGEFGATLVADDAGRELVLKALPTEHWSDVFARGASLANRLRARGYPAPEYVGTGTANGATWSLQERLPGEIPDVVSAAHMHQLLDLCESHAGAGDVHGSWLHGLLPYIEESLRTIENTPLTRSLAVELGAVLHRPTPVSLFEDGIVHGDFHHRNFLAEGSQVTAVFDWEFASVGDWRYDLVTLAFWASLLPGQIPPDAARIAVQRMLETCPADVLAFLTALRAITQLDFDARVHPELLPGAISGIEANIAAWWRAS
jgi:hypothetical protein